MQLLGRPRPKVRKDFLGSLLAYFAGRESASIRGGTLCSCNRVRALPKALCLLLKMLSSGQRHKLRASSYFMVRGAASRSLYRIEIQIIDEAGIEQLDARGNVQYRLQKVPPADCFYEQP